MAGTRLFTILLIAAFSLAYFSHRFLVSSAGPRRIVKRHSIRDTRFHHQWEDDGADEDKDMDELQSMEELLSSHDTGDSSELDGGESLEGEDEEYEEGDADDSPDSDAGLQDDGGIAAPSTGSSAPEFQAVMDLASQSIEPYPTPATEFACIPPQRKRPTRSLDYIVRAPMLPSTCKHASAPAHSAARILHSGACKPRR